MFASRSSRKNRKIPEVDRSKPVFQIEEGDLWDRFAFLLNVLYVHWNVRKGRDDDNPVKVIDREPMVEVIGVWPGKYNPECLSGTFLVKMGSEWCFGDLDHVIVSRLVKKHEEFPRNMSEYLVKCWQDGCSANRGPVGLAVFETVAAIPLEHIDYGEEDESS